MSRHQGRTAIICGGNIIAGKEIMGLELGQGLQAAGMPVIYITSKWGDGAFNRRLDGLGLPHYRIRLGFISATLTFDCIRMTADQLVHLPKMLFDYRGILKSEKVTRVIHTNWHHVLLMWPFLQPERDIFWLHEVVPNKPHYARLFTALARRMRCYAVVSDAVASSLRRIGVPDAKIRIVRNGLSDPTSGQHRRTRATTGCDIGIVGQMGAWKGHEDLLEAFTMISGHQPEARLHIFGDNEREFAQRLIQLAEAGGVAQRVVWHGYVADRSKIYQLIDICVTPSRVDEPFGLTAVEAAFFGVPVIAARKGGLPEIVVDGVTGFLVDAQSPAQLADRLERLLASSELRRRMGMAARERAALHFSRERFIDDFRRLLSCLESRAHVERPV
jgi:glycosyltransferase involved in cell wall biosynthesis